MLTSGAQDGARVAEGPPPLCDHRPLGCPAAINPSVGRTEPTGVATGQLGAGLAGVQSQAVATGTGAGRPRASSVNVSPIASARGPGRPRSFQTAIATRIAPSAVLAARVG